MKSIFTKITDWYEVRGLWKIPFNHERETSFIIEELLESTGKYNSLTARDIAEKMAKEITSSGTGTKEEVADAFGDIIVFCVGTIKRQGYNPEMVLEEVYKKINSRTGKIINDKFVKNQDPNMYKANFDKCKIEQQ